MKNFPNGAAVVVRVRYLGPTTYRGGRWSAQIMNSGMSDRNGSPVILSHDIARRSVESAYEAAQEAARRFLNHEDAPEALMYGHSSPSDYMFFF